MKNLVIIGDNKNVLSSELLSDFKNNIKMIYIDPPYNTQTVKSYNDKVDSNLWKEEIYFVIKQLRTYLKQNGIIFISIDDSEYATLKLICDKIFGRSNFIGTFITKNRREVTANL